MAIAVNNIVNHDTSSPLSYTVPAVSDGVLVVLAGVETTGSPAWGFQYGGVSLTQAVFETTGGGTSNSAGIYYLDTPTAGSANLTWTGTAAFTVLTLSGAATGGPESTASSSDAGTGFTSWNDDITGTSSGSLVLDHFNVGDSSTVTADGSQTQMLNTTTPSSAGYGTSYKSSSGGTVNMAWTFASSRRPTQALASWAAAGAATGNPWYYYAQL